MVARKRKASRPKAGSSSATYQSRVLILNDNISTASAAALGGDNGVVFTTKSFGLPRNAADPKLFEELAAKVRTESSASAIVLTSDRGKKDGIMPIVASHYPYITLVTMSVNGSTNQEKACTALLSLKEFKDPTDYSNRYKRIHLSQMGTTLRVEYVTAKGKHHTKEKRNVFI